MKCVEQAFDTLLAFCVWDKSSSSYYKLPPFLHKMFCFSPAVTFRILQQRVVMLFVLYFLLADVCFLKRSTDSANQLCLFISLDCTTPRSWNTFMKLSEIPSCSCLAPFWYWQFVLSAVSIPKSSPPHFTFSSAVNISCLSIKCGRGMLLSSFTCYLFLNSAF